MWVRGTLQEYLSICEGSLKTLVVWEQELRRVWVWERDVICVWLWVCAYKFWEGECRFCVRERESEETVRSKTRLCLGGAHVCLFCCNTVCVWVTAPWEVIRTAVEWCLSLPLWFITLQMKSSRQALNKPHHCAHWGHMLAMGQDGQLVHLCD